MKSDKAPVKVKVHKRKQAQAVKIDKSQIESIKSDIVSLTEWSTNRIVDNLSDTIEFSNKSSEQDESKNSLFADIIRWGLAFLFISVGALSIITVISKWSYFWTGGIQKICVIFIFEVSCICCALGVSIFREKDKNYIVSMFSALVALVALIISIIK